MSAQKGYKFERFRTTYTHATQIVARSYVHVEGSLENVQHSHLHGSLTRLYGMSI